LEERKYWAKNDEMYLGDLKEAENPMEHFKKNRFIAKKKTDSFEKALTRAFIDP